MEFNLETRICISLKCTKTFRTMPDSPSVYCCEDCKYISGGKKKSLAEVKRRHGRHVKASLKSKNQGVGNGKRYIGKSL
jgi:hypothetical protein